MERYHIVQETRYVYCRPTSLDATQRSFRGSRSFRDNSSHRLGGNQHRIIFFVFHFSLRCLPFLEKIFAGKGVSIPFSLVDNAIELLLTLLRAA